MLVNMMPSDNQGFWQDKFAEKMADFAGIFEASFAEK